jgi:hypothetical protein
MPEEKTRPTSTVVDEFLDGVKNQRRRDDARRMLEMMREVSGEAARMWGASIVGFGVHRYPLANGKVGEICKIGFSPRAGALALYLGDFPQREDCLSRLSRHTTGASCIYVPNLENIEPGVLEELLGNAWERPDGP